MNNLAEVFHLLQSIYIIRKNTIKTNIDQNVISYELMPVLSYINGKPMCSQKCIADALGITPSAVTQSTQKLEKAGLIKKMTNEDNLREKMLVATPKGEETVKNSIAEFDEIDRKVAKDLTDEEITELYEILSKMYKTLKSVNQTHYRELSPWD
ncbi:MAG: MarR family transcriptional regulator [Firmicutes bacterium]|nr:MarR family transcriptional regulator [Bacillota bacterium]